MTGDELRAARKRLGMSQSGLAAALKIKSGDRTIRRMERGDIEVKGAVGVAVELMLERLDQQQERKP